MPKFSVIIPAFNEERNIIKVIDSIRQQSLKDLEIIIVDNGSTDKTVELSVGADRVLNFNDIKNPNSVRNYGAKNSDSQYIAFLDADSSLSSNGLANALNYMRQGYVGGRCVILPPEDKLSAKIQTAILNNWARFIAPQYTPYIFCTREAFENSGGWPEGAGLGDELIFQRRLQEFGRFKFDEDSFVTTSPRRYQKYGYLKTTMLGFLGYCGFKIKWKPVRD